MRGELVTVDEMQEQWVKYISACRAKLLALSTKLAMSVAAAGSPEEVHGLLKTEIYEALTELSYQK